MQHHDVRLLSGQSGHPTARVYYIIRGIINYTVRLGFIVHKTKVQLSHYIQISKQYYHAVSNVMRQITHVVWQAGQCRILRPSPDKTLSHIILTGAFHTLLTHTAKVAGNKYYFVK